MGLFSRGPKIDLAEAQKNKIKMRHLFNQAVPDGDSYEILHATTGSTWKESRLLSDVRVYEVINLVLGFRETDFKIVTVPVNIQLTEFSTPIEISLSEVKTVKYRNKKNNEALEMSFSQPGRPYTSFPVWDIGKKARICPDNISQEEERQKLKAFIEKYQARL